MADSKTTGLRQGKVPYSTMWNIETAFRRITALEARVDKEADPLPATGDFFGQKVRVTSTGKWYAWNGATWDILN